MTGSEEITRLREAFTACTSPAAEGCPPPEKIWEALRGELSPGEVRDVVDHTAACPACAEDWRLAHALEKLSGEAIEPVRRPASQTLRPWLAAAAAVVAILVGVRWSEQWIPRQEPVLRGAEQTAIHSLTREVSRQEPLLEWEGPEGATYEIEVRAGEGLKVIAREKDLKEPKYLVPRSALENLPASTKLYWRVEAVLPDGSRHPGPETFVSVLE